MRRIGEFIGRRLWRRPSRWRYVSGRRRRRGLVLMTLLIVSVYAWWHYTNDSHVRRTAGEYLSRLTGANVRIQQASFGVFDGIKLTGVRIYHDDDGRTADVFLADQVRLKHDPLKLLLSRKLSVTEIICIRPVLTITEDVDKKVWNYQRLFGGASLEAGASLPDNLPVIRIREGLVVRNEIVHGVLFPLCSERISAQAAPLPGRDAYAVEIFNDAAALQASAHAEMGLAPVSFAWTAGAPAALLRRTLPHEYRRWFDAYEIRGDFRFAGQSATDPADNRLTFELSGVSMTLPPAEGGVTFSGLNGKVEFTPDGVRIDRVVGRLPQLNDLAVEVSGYFGGYAVGSPLQIRCDIRDLRFPLSLDGEGEFARRLRRLQDDVQLSGPASVVLRLGRDKDGELLVAGEARVRGMALTSAYFPMPLTDVTGAVEFDGRRVSLRDVRGRSDATEVVVDGWLDVKGDPAVDVRVNVTDLPVGESLDRAMAGSTLRIVRESIRRNCSRFRPSGACGINIHVFTDQPGQRPQIDVDLIFDGALAGAYELFPYALTDVTGKVLIRGDSLTLQTIRARHGDGWVTIDGVAEKLYQRQPDIKLDIDATDLDLNDELAFALEGASEVARRQYEMVGLKGKVDVVGSLTVIDDELDYDLTATLKKASLTHEEFPYPLDSVQGVLRLSPREILVERVTGRRGSGRVIITGSLDLRNDEVTPKLVFDASAVSFDKTMADAIAIGAPETAKVWDAVQPAGTGDIYFVLDPGAAEDGSFPLVVTARNMSVTCREFPYPLAGLRGVAAIRRDRVELRKLTGGTGGASVAIDGAMEIDDGEIASADLTLRASDLPIETTLLDAMPKGLRPVTRNFESIGRLDVDLPRVQYRRPADVPVSEVVVESTDAEDAETPRVWPWRVEGGVRLHGATMNFAVSIAEVEGAAHGWVVADNRTGDFAVDAELEGESLRLWGREATNLRGRIHKDRGPSDLRIADLVAQISGGRMAGSIDLESGADGACKMKLEVEDVRVADLLNGRADSAETAQSGPGKMSGWMSMEAIGGAQPRRQGSGKLVISDAKIGKIPLFLGLVSIVLLDLPTESYFSKGEVEYIVEDDKLVCTRIFLTGEGASVVPLAKAGTSIVGAGTVDLLTKELDVAFRTGPPHLLTGVFGELWSKTVSGLSTTHVTGSWDDPQVRTVPLSKIQSLIGEVIGMRR